MIRIVGGGLAGSEAAWQAATRGVPVMLHEMRPMRPTAVHKTDRRDDMMQGGACPWRGPGSGGGDSADTARGRHCCAVRDLGV